MLLELLTWPGAVSPKDRKKAKEILQAYRKDQQVVHLHSRLQELGESCRYALETAQVPVYCYAKT